MNGNNLQTFYYTFGSHEQFPYQGGWVEVKANSFKEAHKLFKTWFPNVNEGVLNCSDFYTEQAFKETEMYKGNNNLGANCQAVIDCKGIVFSSLSTRHFATPQRMAEIANGALDALCESVDRHYLYDVLSQFMDDEEITKAGFDCVSEPEGLEESLDFPPVYYETFRHAIDIDGDKTLYHNSNKLNDECAAAIDKTILDVAEYRGMPGAYSYDLQTALDNVTAEYGSERVTAVVAHVVCKYEWDGRLSRGNKEWARSIAVPKVDYIPLKTHLAVFDGFVNYARKAHQQEHQQCLPKPKNREDREER